MSRSTPELARDYAGGEDLDRLVIDAICMRLSAAVEALARLDPNARARLFGDNCQNCPGSQVRVLGRLTP